MRSAWLLLAPEYGVQALTGWGVDMAEGAEGGGALIFTLRTLCTVHGTVSW